MSTTILETPLRVIKLIDGKGKTDCNKLSPRRHNNLICDIPPIEINKESKVIQDSIMTIHDTIDTVANTLRDPIAEIQEKRGISKTQRYTFIDLMTSIFNHTYEACVGIITMIIGLLPLMEGMLALLRFILDKIIEVNNIQSLPEKICKGIIFIGELFIIFIVVSTILSLILLPVFGLCYYGFTRIWAFIKH